MSQPDTMMSVEEAHQTLDDAEQELRKSGKTGLAFRLEEIREVFFNHGERCMCGGCTWDGDYCE